MKKVVIVGGVAGGASCAARLRRLDESTELVLLERGEYVSYANCGLPYYVGGVISRGLRPRRTNDGAAGRARQPHGDREGGRHTDAALFSGRGNDPPDARGCRAAGQKKARGGGFVPRRRLIPLSKRKKALPQVGGISFFEKVWLAEPCGLPIFLSCPLTRHRRLLRACPRLCNLSRP